MYCVRKLYTQSFRVLAQALQARHSSRIAVWLYDTPPQAYATVEDWINDLKDPSVRTLMLLPNFYWDLLNMLWTLLHTASTEIVHAFRHPPSTLDLYKVGISAITISNIEPAVYSNHNMCSISPANICTLSGSPIIIDSFRRWLINYSMTIRAIWIIGYLVRFQRSTYATSALSTFPQELRS